MFTKRNTQAGYVELADGISIKTLTHGEKTLTAQFVLQKGSAIPLHQHLFEQTGYLIEGKMEFIIDGERYVAEPGDSWNIGGNIEHSAIALEDSVVLEVFAPLRDDYLPMNLEKKYKKVS